MFAIYKREMRSYLFSPLPYILLGLFICILAIIFSSAINNPNAEFSPQFITGILGFSQFILMVLIPILTMRVLAEERKNKSDVVLISAPISITKIVLAKYLSLLTVLLVITLSSGIFPIIMAYHKSFYFAQTLGGYLGFFLLAACLVAIGLFASSLTKNQIIAAVVSFVINMVFYIATAFDGWGAVGTVMKWISLFARYEDFQNGLLNIPSVLFYISFMGIFIFATIRMIEKRRWS